MDSIGAQVKPVSNPLLTFTGTVSVSATTAKFIAKEKLVCDTGPKATVKWSYLHGNFTEWFLGDGGKIEKPITEKTLHVYMLCKRSADAPIIAELGGEERVETTLSEMYALTEKQPRGEPGVLLTDGCVNIFYIRDIYGLLRAVDVRWDGDGWGVDASSVNDPSKWEAGLRLFFRYSVLVSPATSVQTQT